MNLNLSLNNPFWRQLQVKLVISSDTFSTFSTPEILVLLDKLGNKTANTLKEAAANEPTSGLKSFHEVATQEARLVEENGVLTLIVTFPVDFGLELDTHDVLEHYSAIAEGLAYNELRRFNKYGI